ncbi:Uncharacterised protein [Campylobacter hyointestinalis subsp. hyointestinalis]|nr:hypothetical protein [Campylobacter hyointestinalis]CUU79432.1 Uncharacterised protein [Campylobacter hyointestinalis subsp. hyointestinalis]
MSNINLNVRSNLETIDSNIKINIKNRLDINIGAIVNYSCNGQVDGDQPKNLGVFTIPNSKSVKQVKIQFSSSSIDDYPVVIIGNNRYTNGWTASDGYSLNWIGTYNIALDNTNKITIKAGVGNTGTGSCYMINGYLNLTFYY